MKKSVLTKLIFIILIITFILLIMTIKSNAASVSIKASKSSVSPGEKFSVTVSVTGGAGYINLSASNGTLSSTSIDLMLQSSVTVNCTAGNSGSVKISGSGVIADNITEQDDKISASTTVTIISNSSSGSSGSSSNKPNNSNTNNDDTPKSTDSSLKGLSVEEGAITPEFNKDVKEYTLTVPNEIGGANVTAIPNDSKATVSVTGNVGLKEGENTVTILVTAEDGSTSKYLIRVIREKPALSLQSLVIRYKNQEGQLIEVPLNPVFNFETYEYTIEDLEHWVETLEIDAIPNIEGAKIDIQGADNLVQGENTITITLKVPLENNGELPEGEEPQEETKTYTIKLNKKAEPVPPTLMGKISNWFNGIFGGVTSWYNNNQEQAILGALAICVVALLGLSIYIIVDYKKYKTLIQKLNKLNDIENAEPLQENIIQNIAQKRIQEKDMSESFNDIEKNRNDRPKGGRHF